VLRLPSPALWVPTGGKFLTCDPPLPLMRFIDGQNGKQEDATSGLLLMGLMCFGGSLPLTARILRDSVTPT